MEWLVIGGGALLLYSLFQQQGGGQAPPGTQPGAGAGGANPAGGGGLTTAQNVSIAETAVTAGAGLTGTAVVIVTKLFSGGTATGSGTAGATGGTSAAVGETTGDAVGGATGAEAGADVVSDVSVGAVVGSVAADLGIAVAVDVAIAALFLPLMISSEAVAGQLNQLTQLIVRKEPGNRFTTAIYAAENTAVDNLLTSLIAKLNATPPPYVNFNAPTVYSGATFGRYNGQRWTASSALSGFGAGAGIAKAGGGTVASKNLTALMAAQSVAPAANLPSPTTPYGFTRKATLDLDPTTANPDAAEAYIAATLGPYFGYFVNSIDPRLPTAKMVQFRQFARWLTWTKMRSQNTVLGNFYRYLDSVRNGDVTGGASSYYLSDTDFNTYTTQFFSALPLEFQPPKVITTNDYQSLNAIAYELMTDSAAAAGRSVNFELYTAQVEFIGTALAARQAAIWGFGNGIQWSSSWPGDQVFVTDMMDALGLTAAGWAWGSQNVLAQGQRLLLIDPRTNWALDVIAQRDTHALAIYKASTLPGMTNLQVPVDVSQFAGARYGRYGRLGGRLGGQRRMASFGDATTFVPLNAAAAAGGGLLGLAAAAALAWYLMRDKK